MILRSPVPSPPPFVAYRNKWTCIKKCVSNLSIELPKNHPLPINTIYNRERKPTGESPISERRGVEALAGLLLMSYELVDGDALEPRGLEETLGDTR